MSTPLSARGFELVWVNASSSGPSEQNSASPERYQVIRSQPGQNKKISRSGTDHITDLVNDLDDKVNFPHAKVVSREHASIEWVDGAAIIKDLGSTHGTFVAHKQATTLSSGRFAEHDALAVLKRVNGIERLKDGDLIEFGRTTVRPDKTYHPVRCYIRVPPAATQPTSNDPARKSGVYRLSDDCLESDSDMPSINASVDASTTILGDRMKVAQDTIDLTSDDEEGVVSSPIQKASILSPAFLVHDANESTGSAFGVGGIFDDSSPESDSDDESVDPYDLSRIVPLRDEIHDLDREASDARKEGELYMNAYKTANLPDSPATSTGGGSPNLSSKEDTHDFSAAKKLFERLSSDGTPAVIAAAGPSIEQSAQSSVVIEDPYSLLKLKASPLKRKADDAQIRKMQACEAPVSQAEPAEVKPEAPEPCKKMRLSPEPEPHVHVQKRQENPAPPRARKMRRIVTKVIQTTSLLSVGFLAGGLFTFKSLMNNHAPANANGK